MKPKLFASLLLVVLSGAQFAIAQQQTTPALDRPTRLMVASKLNQLVRSSEASQSAIDRMDTQYMAMVNPVATADYILKNPPPNGQTTLWDHHAILFLTCHPDQLSDQQLLRLIENQIDEVFYIYARQLLRHLPADRIELHNSIAEQVERRMGQLTATTSFDVLVGQLRTAQALKHPAITAQAKAKLDQYFTSGQARRDLDQLQASMDAGRLPRSPLPPFGHFAPQQLKSDFTDTPGRPMPSILADPQLTPEQKVAEISQLDPTKFSEYSHQSIPLASQLGQVARLSLPLAWSIRQQLPNDTIRAWADLNIAVGIAGNQPEEAKKLISAAYQSLIQQSKSKEALESDYNYPAALVAAIGLKAVQHVAPEQLAAAIAAVAQAAPPLLTSIQGDARSNYFEVAAAVARYDLEKAKLIFDQGAKNVDLHDSASFFVALAAIHPSEILREYEGIPVVASQNGVAYRPFIRKALLPALTAHNDAEFWDSLAAHSNLVLDDLE